MYNELKHKQVVRARKALDRRRKYSRVLFQWDPRGNKTISAKPQRVGMYSRETTLEIIELRRAQLG